MTLSDLAAIGSILSSLAVAVSIFYLGVQTHQATKHTKALISQGRASRQTDFLTAFSEADRVAAMVEVTTGTPATPTVIKERQTRMFFQGCFAGWLDVFEQYQMGLLNEDQFADLRAAISGILQPPPARNFWEQWKAVRPNTHVAFKAWVDDALAKPVNMP
jgi:hypothetical protein